MPHRLPNSLVAVVAFGALAVAPAAAQVPLPGGLPGTPPPSSSPPPPDDSQPPAPPPDDKPASPPGPRTVQLSNERTRTLWAHAVDRATAHKRPDSKSPGVGNLRYDTEDGYPEVYLALTQYTDRRVASGCASACRSGRTAPSAGSAGPTSAASIRSTPSC